VPPSPQPRCARPRRRRGRERRACHAGVRAVITAKDIGAVPRIPLRLLPLPGTERFLQAVIAADRVCYVGASPSPRAG
jgi:hypothetical protein